jgi:hypothetical protein
MSYFNKISKSHLKKKYISSKSKKYKKRRSTRKIYRKGGMFKNASTAVFRASKTVGSEIAKDQLKRKMQDIEKTKTILQPRTNLNPWANQTNSLNPNLQTFNPKLQTFNPNLQTFNPNLDPLDK